MGALQPAEGNFRDVSRNPSRRFDVHQSNQALVFSIQGRPATPCPGLPGDVAADTGGKCFPDAPLATRIASWRLGSGSSLSFPGTAWGTASKRLEAPGFRAGSSSCHRHRRQRVGRPESPNRPHCLGAATKRRRQAAGVGFRSLGSALVRLAAGCPRPGGQNPSDRARASPVTDGFFGVSHHDGFWPMRCAAQAEHWGGARVTVGAAPGPPVSAPAPPPEPRSMGEPGPSLPRILS